MHYEKCGSGVLKFLLGCEALGIKEKNSSRGVAMSNTFHLFNYPKPRS